MKKENIRLIALIIIIIAAIGIISNKATVPYNEVRQDIERSVNDDGNSIIDFNIKKKLNKYNYECFLCSVKYENN